MDREFLVYLAIVRVATLIIGVDLWRNTYENMADALRYGLFQVVSIQTTTGFGTADYEQWSYSSQFILFVLMFLSAAAPVQPVAV
ncbi:MAG: potassium transporter TrkG [Caldilineaceae bacterium]